MDNVHIKQETEESVNNGKNILIAFISVQKDCFIRLFDEIKYWQRESNMESPHNGEC